MMASATALSLAACSGSGTTETTQAPESTTAAPVETTTAVPTEPETTEFPIACSFLSLGVNQVIKIHVKFAVAA